MNDIDDIVYKGNINDDEPHTALGICLILFAGQLGIIAEIIMIASYKREDKIDKIENYFIYN